MPKLLAHRILMQTHVRQSSGHFSVGGSYHNSAQSVATVGNAVSHWLHGQSFGSGRSALLEGL